jgi:hypothetical protein
MVLGSLPPHKGFALRDEPNDSYMIFVAGKASELGCRAKTWRQNNSRDGKEEWIPA